jgi:hypothetical protein
MTDQHTSLLRLMKSFKVQDSGACIIKLFTAVINYVMYLVHVFVIVNNSLFTLTNTLAFYIMELITDVKSFMIQAPGVCTIKLFTAAIVTIS